MGQANLLRLRLEVEVDFDRNLPEGGYLTNEQEQQIIARLERAGLFLADQGMLSPDDLDVNLNWDSRVVQYIP